MSPIYRNHVQINGRFVRCPTCQAPFVDPIPPRWPVTLKGEISDAAITLHLPDCEFLDELRKGTDHAEG